MTPFLAIARAPADSVTLIIAGSSSGDRPTASATANSSESIIGRARKQVRGQHKQNDDDHHPKQEIAEIPNAALKIRLGRVCLELCYDRAEGGSAPGFDDEHLRLAALDRRAEVDCVGARRDGCLRRNDPGLLLDGERLAGQAGLVDQEVGCLDQEPVGRNEVACR